MIMPRSDYSSTVNPEGFEGGVVSIVVEVEEEVVAALVVVVAPLAVHAVHP
jgi:hypothetical protein